MPQHLQPVDEDWTTGLAVVAHPDDLEYGVASAIARWTAQGKTITYLLITDGEAGIDGMDPAEAGPLRRDDEIRSAAAVGVDQVEFLGHPDGCVENNQELRHDLAAAIRRHRPDCIISMNFRENFGNAGWNHVDHRNLGPALLDAARDAANRWIFTDLIDEGLDPWKGTRMVLFGASPEAMHGVDVTESIEKGIDSLKEHQVYLSALDDGTIGKDPEPFIRRSAASMGPLMGTKYAVPFELIPI